MIKRIIAVAILAAASSSCGVLSSDSALQADVEAPYNGSIRVSLKHPADAAKNDYSLLFAASQTTVGLGVCVAKKTPSCTVGGAGYFASKLIFNDGKKNFFMPNSSAILEDGLILTVVGTDKDGNVIDTRNVKFSNGSAGAVASDTPATTPTTTPTTTTPTTTTPTTPTTTGGTTGGTTGQNDFPGGGTTGGGGNFGGGGGGW